MKTEGTFTTDLHPIEREPGHEVVIVRQGSNVLAEVWTPESGIKSERDSNAKLFAAAPKLLKACKLWIELFDHLDRVSTPGDALSAIRAEYHAKRLEVTREAIADAEGSTP